VLRATVHATDQTDVDAEVTRLRADCKRSGLPGDTVDLIASQVQETLSDLVARGRELAAMGSQMSVTRGIADQAFPDSGILFMGL
jgi:hypothetical protein